MNKAELIAAASIDTDFTKAECSRVLDAILKNLCDSLSRGRSVYLAGFGTFALSSRAERIGRNPRSGEPMTVKASKGAKFTAAKALKERLNSTE